MVFQNVEVAPSHVRDAALAGQLTGAHAPRSGLLSQPGLMCHAVWVNPVSDTRVWLALSGLVLVVLTWSGNVIVSKIILTEASPVTRPSPS